MSPTPSPGLLLIQLLGGSGHDIVSPRASPIFPTLLDVLWGRKVGRKVGGAGGVGGAVGVGAWRRPAGVKLGHPASHLLRGA